MVKLEKIRKEFDVSTTQLTDSQVMDLFILIRHTFPDLMVTYRPIVELSCNDGEYFSIGNDFGEAVAGLLGQVSKDIDKDKAKEILTREYKWGYYEKNRRDRYILNELSHGINGEIKW